MIRPPIPPLALLHDRASRLPWPVPEMLDSKLVLVTVAHDAPSLACLSVAALAIGLILLVSSFS